MNHFQVFEAGTPATAAPIPVLDGIGDHSPLAEALALREEAIRGTHDSYRSLFDDIDGARLSETQRFTLALASADSHHDATLAAHYREGLLASSDHPAAGNRLQAPLEHVRRLSTTPVSIEADDLQTLRAAGWSADALVTLSQLVAYVSFQSRLNAGIALLAGKNVHAPSGPAVGAASLQPRTAELGTLAATPRPGLAV